MIKKIAFTMYPVTDMKRARKFYEEELGLKSTVDIRGEWIEYDLAGGCFAITTMVKDSVSPSASAGGSIAFEVENVDALTDRLRSRGVAVKFGPIQTPVCRMAVVLDPEGNALTLHQITD
jgi:predicted enzyme related to lactoylglutathione lyase